MTTLEEQFASMDLQDNTLLVHVKLLSGDILPITVQKEYFSLALPAEFVRQARYNPSVVSRLLFLDENGQNILDDPWQKRFPPVQDIPLIHVLLQDEEDEHRQAKLDLFHKILQDKNLKTDLDQDAIWTMYSSWNITYAPSKKTNRYIKLLDFALAHPLIFQEMTMEEIQQRKQAKKEQEERNAEQSRIRVWIQMRDVDLRIITRRMTSQEFVQQREQTRALLLQMIQQSPDFSFLDTLQGLQNRRVILYHFTVPELIAMGIPTHKLSVDWWIIRWEEYSAKAEAYLAQTQTH
jgi:hypothetical protein